MAPQPTHPCEVVLQLRQLHLQLALGAGRVVGEDVEDDRRPVDHRQAQRLFEVALLAGTQLIVAGDQVGVALMCGLRASPTLPGPRYVFGWGSSRRWTSSPTTATPAVSQQLTQLSQILAVGQGGYAQGSLACALGLFHLTSV